MKIKGIVLPSSRICSIIHFIDSIRRGPSRIAIYLITKIQFWQGTRRSSHFPTKKKGGLLDLNPSYRVHSLSYCLLGYEVQFFFILFVSWSITFRSRSDFFLLNTKLRSLQQEINTDKEVEINFLMKFPKHLRELIHSYLNVDHIFYSFLLSKFFLYFILFSCLSSI